MHTRSIFNLTGACCVRPTRPPCPHVCRGNVELCPQSHHIAIRTTDAGFLVLRPAQAVVATNRAARKIASQEGNAAGRERHAAFEVKAAAERAEQEARARAEEERHRLVQQRYQTEMQAYQEAVKQDRREREAFTVLRNLGIQWRGMTPPEWVHVRKKLLDTYTCGKTEAAWIASVQDMILGPVEPVQLIAELKVESVAPSVRIDVASLESL